MKSEKDFYSNTGLGKEKEKNESYFCKPWMFVNVLSFMNCRSKLLENSPTAG